MKPGDDIETIGLAGYDGRSNPLAAAISERDKDILTMVRRSLDRKSVVLAYQPVVEARLPYRTAFYEGLIRVVDDTGRIIPAMDFIGACESHEIGRIIDCLALEFGLAELANAPGLRLAINMSARSIGYPRWMQTLEVGLAGSPTIAERLIIEITESSAILMPDITMVFMDRLQTLGVAFALDDFGAGYTSFRHLRDLDFDIVKIAGEFITGLHAKPDNRVLTQALVAISQQFGMLTVAEAVESDDDSRVLEQMGVDCLQGYRFGVPSTHPAWRELSASPVRSG